jgi:hypothetical protein
MTTKNGAVRKAGTHFEQVPVAVAKKVAAENSSTAKAGTDSIVVDPASKTQRHMKATF